MATNNVFDFLDTKVLDRIRSENIDFMSRVTDAGQEYVDYLNDSSIRIWYNKETIGFPLHWHYAVEVIAVLEDSYTINTKSRQYVLNPGDVLIIPAGELHEIETSESGSRLIFLFEFQTISKLEGFAALMPYFSQPVYLQKNETSSSYNRCISLLKQIAREYADQNPFFELIIYSRLLSLLVTIGRQKRIGNKENDGLFDSKQNELNKKLSIAFEYIDSHYVEEISLEKVASISGFSKFHFSRLFKQCSGQNFHEYLCFKRVQASEVLLLKPEMSITEIAFKSGFSSLSTFNRAFKTINQCSPTEYRMLYSKLPQQS